MFHGGPETQRASTRVSTRQAESLRHVGLCGLEVSTHCCCVSEVVQEPLQNLG